MRLCDLSLKAKLLATNALMMAIPICVLVVIGAALLGAATYGHIAAASTGTPLAGEGECALCAIRPELITRRVGEK